MKLNQFIFSDSDTNTLILFIGLIVTGTIFHSVLYPPVNVSSEKLTYLHYHFIKVIVKGSEDIFKGAAAFARIYKDGEKVTTIAKQDKVTFKYNKEKKQWYGKFPVPWGAPEGVYLLKLFVDEKPVGLDDTFYIKTRIPSFKMEKPLKILDLESMKRLRSFKIRLPSGEKTGYQGIYEWMKFIGSNTLWYIAGQTASYRKGDLSEDSPWVKDNLETLKKFSEETNKRGIDFGAWISCFRAFGRKDLKPGWYKYSYKYRRSKGTVYETDGISILNNSRIDDIVKLAAKFNNMDSINYIGLDYIRPAGGGLELVDEFVQAMDINVPEGWEKFTKKDRMKWLGDIVTRSNNRDVPVIDKWNWWRAQRISKIISHIKEKVKLKKPLWTFVLSWELGHQHGQDPIMFQDAGSDLISVMIYETDSRRFDLIMERWRKYLKDFKVNVAIGNQIDWVLHQYSVYPSGPEEYSRRLEKGREYMSESGNLKGIFIHDFARALWGRLGPYSTVEWLASAAKSFSGIQRKINIDIELPDVIEAGKTVGGILKLKNNTDAEIADTKIDFINRYGIKISCKMDFIDKLKKNEVKEIPFSIKAEGVLDRRMGRYMAAVRIINGDDVHTDYKYFWLKDIFVDRGCNYR